MVGGMVRKGGCVAGLPVCVSVSPVCVLASPFRLRGGPVEWREWWVVCCPRVRIGSLPFILSVPFVSFLFLFCLVLLCLLWVGKCGGGTVSRFPLLLPTVCVLCHIIVDLVPCLCGRVVSLWNSGVDLVPCLCGRVVSIVYCLLSTHHPCCGVHLSGVCVVMGCVMTVHVLSCRIVLWVVEWRCVRCSWSRYLSSSSSSSSSLCWCSG